MLGVQRRLMPVKCRREAVAHFAVSLRKCSAQSIVMRVLAV